MHPTSQKIRWGVLGVAGIAVRKVIPAMQNGKHSQITAIASRNHARAVEAANSLSIPKAYGSYDELLNDPEIDAIYNPLPNHLHVPWSIKAAEAGKHVLCEKPVALSVAETRSLIAARDRTGVKIGEAFMVRTHPQWLRTIELVRSGAIGDLRAAMGFFSYFNRKPENIRNIPEFGGGALMDIGCYPIFTSRLLFGEEPQAVSASIRRDPELGVDIVTSAILEFPNGDAVFTCSMQLVPYQRMNFFGTNGRIELEIPFNAPNDRPCRILIDNGQDVFGSGIRVEEIDTVDQYTVQGDAFSQTIRENGPVPVPLEDSIRNMAVIEAVFRSASSGRRETPQRD